MEDTYPDDIEVAPKGDAHCKRCREKIYKGDVRLRENRYDIKYHSVNTYVCYKCIKTYMKDKISKAKDLFLKMSGIPILLDQLVKDNKKQIKINDSLRQKEKLVKEIEYGNQKEKWRRGIRL
jgi:hypothetical protein